MRRIVSLPSIVLPVLVFGLVGLSGATAVAQGSSTVDSSSVTFKIRNMGIGVNGSFRDLEAEVDFDPRRLDQSRIQASLPAATIDTGIGMRDRKLRQEKYFDVDQYPRIEMLSTGFRAEGKGQFVGTFLLRLKGTEREVELPFTLNPNAAATEFQGSFVLDRQDYGVGGNSLMLSDEVTISIYLRVR